MAYCAVAAYVFIPIDFLWTPTADDVEVWLGVALHGRAAKITAPLHFLIYAAGAYGFWRLKGWMWPWAAVYAGSVAVGSFVWSMNQHGGFWGFVLGLLSGGAVGAVAYALWESRHLFEPASLELRDRYGEWAIVTGASAGLGSEFARALAREGISCVLIARREDRLRELSKEIELRHGVKTRVIAADLARAESAEEIARAVADLDVGILVNNAGAGYAGRFDKQDGERLRQMVELNCVAPLMLTHRLLPRLIERRRGAVVIVGSVAGRQAIPLHAVYAATKAFDLFLGEALWAELRDLGIDVSVLMPGPVASEFESVAGEARPDPGMDEAPDECVRIALSALGRQPSVVSGTWMNWARANANRFLPRVVITSIAGDYMARQTPADMR
jgi:hypothetical protein